MNRNMVATLNRVGFVHFSGREKWAKGSPDSGKNKSKSPGT